MANKKTANCIQGQTDLILEELNDIGAVEPSGVAQGCINEKTEIVQREIIGFFGILFLSFSGHVAIHS